MLEDQKIEYDQDNSIGWGLRSQMKSGIRIAVIGGGSSYTPELISGLLDVDDLAIEQVTLVDIPEGRDKMEIIRAFCQRLIDHSNKKFILQATCNRHQALADADFVLSQFRVGGLNARARDESIPLKYGVIGQETVGAGGFASALRTIPVALELARELEELNPAAWLINFTNPSGMITEALLRYQGIRTIGLCNVPITIERTIAEALHVSPDVISIDFLGLNHLSFARHVYVQGKDITPLVLEFLKNMSQEAVKNSVANIPKETWPPYLLDAVPMIPNPYLQYYWNTDVMLRKQLADIENGKGTRAIQVMAIEAELFKQYQNPQQVTLPELLMQRGGAYYSTVAVMLMESFALNKRREMVVNVKNDQALDVLPADSVVEVPAVIDGRGARAITMEPVPLEVKGLIQQVKAYEQLTIEAAVEGHRGKALAALLTNPLVPSSEIAHKILDDILRENAAYLPQFAS